MKTVETKIYMRADGKLKEEVEKELEIEDPAIHDAQARMRQHEEFLGSGNYESSLDKSE